MMAGNIPARITGPRANFLASTDERFRPVWLTPAGNGSVYIVDMYRGVSQDEPIQTDYLKNYILQHRLWDGIHKGRIYRIIRTGMKPARAKPHMIEETPAELVAHLSDADGWWRDTAQQLLVQRNDKSAVPALKHWRSAHPMPAPASRRFGRLPAWARWMPRPCCMRWTMPILMSAMPACAALSPSGQGRCGDPGGGDQKVWRCQLAGAPAIGRVPGRVAARGPRHPGSFRCSRNMAATKSRSMAGITGLKGQEADALDQLLADASANADAVEMLAAPRPKAVTPPRWKS